ncbi:hypothetical protein D4L83_18850 [Escherichia coli]|nr:hypothetical protein D4L83_18850 [Escherichia coli]
MTQAPSGVPVVFWHKQIQTSDRRGGQSGQGGGKAHTPVEAKDNLKSTQMMSVIDAIGEGPIEGPVKGLQSIPGEQNPADGHGR